MFTKVSRRGGPGAVGLGTRKYKRTLLHFAANRPDVRLTLIGFSHRIVEHSDCDASPGDWKRLVESGRVVFYAAISDGTNVDAVSKMLIEMRGDGLRSALINSDGQTAFSYLE
jgi:hypothetical protein